MLTLSNIIIAKVIQNSVLDITDSLTTGPDSTVPTSTINSQSDYSATVECLSSTTGFAQAPSLAHDHRTLTVRGFSQEAAPRIPTPQYYLGIGQGG